MDIVHWECPTSGWIALDVANPPVGVLGGCDYDDLILEEGQLVRADSSAVHQRFYLLLCRPALRCLTHTHRCTLPTQSYTGIQYVPKCLLAECGVQAANDIHVSLFGYILLLIFSHCVIVMRGSAVCLLAIANKPSSTA